MEEDAETAPFAESNTFRHIARTGQPVVLTSAAARLRIEVSYQLGGVPGDGDGGALATLLGDAYAEALAEEPFCVLTLPLPYHHRPLGAGDPRITTSSREPY